MSRPRYFIDPLINIINLRTMVEERWIDDGWLGLTVSKREHKGGLRGSTSSPPEIQENY
jgi:hypothetical protein